MSLNRWTAFTQEELEILSEAIAQIEDSNLSISTEAVQSLADEIDNELFARDVELEEEPE